MLWRIGTILHVSIWKRLVSNWRREALWKKLIPKVYILNGPIYFSIKTSWNFTHSARTQQMRDGRKGQEELLGYWYVLFLIWLVTPCVIICDNWPIHLCFAPFLYLCYASTIMFKIGYRKWFKNHPKFTTQM